MRESIAAFALMGRVHGGQRQWLAQWNDHWERYNFVGGHKRSDETFRECIVREIAEELALVDGTHVTVAEEPAAHLQYQAWSHRANEDTQYVIEVFPSPLLSHEVESIIDANPLNRWLDESEIRAQQTADGRWVSEIMWMVLAQVGLVECDVDLGIATELQPDDWEASLDGASVVDECLTGGGSKELTTSKSHRGEPANMSTEFSQKTVAVSVIYDETSARFLLWHNPRWHGYAFPMKKFQVEAGKSAEQAARQACCEWNVPLPGVQPDSVEPAGCWRDRHYSEGTRQVTDYDYHLFRVHLPEMDEPSLHPDLRYFTFEELQNTPTVTYSTKSIAAWLVGDRDVVAAILTRTVEQGQQFLLVRNAQGKYFLPATRLLRHARAADEVARLVHMDLGYEGALEVVAETQVDTAQASERFGLRPTNFHFHLCLLNLPGVDLTEYGNVLEQSLADVASTWARTDSKLSISDYQDWFTVEQMRTHRDMSPTLDAVLPAVLQLTEKHC